jgi:GT2 family glycosyltransferase
VPTVSIITVTFGTGPIVLRMLDAVAANTGLAHEVIVVDNPPADGRPATRELLSGRAGVQLVQPTENLGFSGGNELGADRATAPFVCFLNPDVIVGPRWLEPLLGALADPVVGIAAPPLLNEDGSIQEAGQLLYDDACTAAVGGPEVLTDDRQQLFARDVDYASAACWVVRADEHRRRGGFDRRYHPAFFEDVDYALRVEADGQRTRLVVDVPVVHLHGQGGAGRNLELGQAAQRTFRSIWSERIARQPPRPTNDQDAIGNRDRLAERSVLIAAPRRDSSRRARCLAFDDAVGQAAERPRDRVTFMTDDPSGLDVDGARRRGLEVLIGDVDAAVAVRGGTATELVRVSTGRLPARIIGRFRRR